MADKKKGKRRKEEYVAPGEDIFGKPTKEEYKVAKWLRKNVPIKRTKFLNHNVEYFIACKAIDGLMESQWCKSADPYFKTREEVVDFLQVMLEHKFYHRARKVPVSEQELKARKKEKKSTESSDEKKKDEKDKDKKDKTTDNEGNADSKENTDKKKRKIRLEMHNDQRFLDGIDAYVWIYDPIPFHYWIIGALLVLGAIGVCLFPLWPPSVRLGVYYLSVAAAAFLVFIIILAVLRLVFFCLVWILTMGNHHIWILPNLTEDVGFFASFWPLYTYEYKGAVDGNKKDKKQQKDKNSDAEDEPEKAKDKILPTPEGTPVKEKRKQSKEEDRNSENGTQADYVGASESESESSQRSSTGKDFEILDREELDS